MTNTRPLRVLLTNDDGPPTTATGNSPFVYPFAQALRSQLGWDVRVVVPSSQKSWVGKSYIIGSTITAHYFYPKGEDGSEGELTDLPRPVVKGEDPPWVLVDGTPATCSNLALYSLWPNETFDLVIAGPNYGRNTSTAFALSSGTIGSAMAASLSGIPSIALSFGFMTGHKPPGDAIVQGAILASCKLVSKLWEVGWGSGEDRIGVYSVNVPLVPEMKEENVEVEFTTMARTSYQRLFKSTTKAPADNGGPAAIPESEDGEAKEDDNIFQLRDEHHAIPLSFAFAPDISSIIDPHPASLVQGTDTHAIHSGKISVTPLLASFASGPPPSRNFRL